MRFEKWQALGNDYVIVERDALPWPLTAGRVRRLCDVHHGVGADGVLELAPADEPGFVARLRIFNPDGSEAELSGNGAREAVLYLRRRGWTDQREFSIQTAAGEIRPTVHDERTCTLDMGRARLQSPDFPDGPQDGVAMLDAAGRPWRVQHVQVGNPQAAILLDTPGQVDALDVAVIGPALEHHDAFPNRTNVSFSAVVAAGRLRTRIFERGVGETSASGTGACGAAIAHVLRGGDSPVTVELDGGELEVDVDEALGFRLTGWAEPVFAGEASAELLAALADG
jgi:diaminopimelate epimerase